MIAPKLQHTALNPNLSMCVPEYPCISDGANWTNDNGTQELRGELFNILTVRNCGTQAVRNAILP